MKKPNVILLTTHDTGRHVSPYGISTVDTRNCERLAAESVLFENSFCTAPQCSPSRASIVTGRYPHCNGTMGLSHLDFGWGMHESERPVAKLLNEGGYDTWLMGMQHETRDAESLGFDHIDLGFTLLELPEHLGPRLDAWNGEKPFYCQIGCFETHRPFEGHGTEPDDRLGLTVPPYLVDGPETREEIRGMQGLIRRFDTGLGQLLDLLDARGLKENTLLIVTTDHGLPLPRAKGSLFDPGIETMLFMRYPARFPGGVRKAEMISHVDLLPTVLELTGQPVPENVQGRSLLPLLEGRPYEPRTEIFAEKTFHGCYDPMRCIRTQTHKYIRFFEKSSIHRVPGDALEGGASREMGVMRRPGMEELYDLTRDPLEQKNLAENPEHRDLCAELRRRLAGWMKETNDPLLKGPIASPYYERSIRELLSD